MFADSSPCSTDSSGWAGSAAAIEYPGTLPHSPPLPLTPPHLHPPTPHTSIHPHPTPPSTYTTIHPHHHPPTPPSTLPLARVSSFSQLLTASSSLTTPVSRSFPCCEDTNNGKYLGGADCCPMDLKNNIFGLFLRSVFAQANEIMFRVEKW